MKDKNIEYWYIYFIIPIILLFFPNTDYSPTFISSISNDMFSEFYKKNAFFNATEEFIDVPGYIRQISTKDWMTEELTERLNNPYDISKCTHCQSSSISNRKKKHGKTTGNSSERDLILTLTLYASLNLETFVRSLRSTGCKAKIVIFHDERSYKTLNRYMTTLMDHCGVILVDVGNIVGDYVKHTYEIRHLWFYYFIQKYRSMFDRIIVTDIADAFFQSDPFTTEFTNTTFQVTTELVPLDKTDVNRDWVMKSDPHYDPVFYYGRIPLCFGLLYGSTLGWLKFYNVIFSQRAWNQFEIKTIDQGYLNYYFYRGFFERNGLYVTATMPNDLIVSARGSDGKMDSDTETNYVMIKNSEKVPAMIHHYNRVCLFIDNIKEVCPSLNMNTTYAYAKPKETKCP